MFVAFQCIGNSKILHEISLNIVYCDKKEITVDFPSALFHSQIPKRSFLCTKPGCAAPSDSGGPLICSIPHNSKKFLIGVASQAGHGCKIIE